MPIEQKEYWFDFDTHTFVDHPISFNYPDPPEKMTQEEWKYMKIIATATKDWWSLRNSATTVAHLNQQTMRDMGRVYDIVDTAQKVANLFGDRKRIKDITEYAKKNYRAAIYHVTEQRV